MIFTMIVPYGRNARFESKGDVAAFTGHVCLTYESGHSCIPARYDTP